MARRPEDSSDKMQGVWWISRYRKLESVLGGAGLVLLVPYTTRARRPANSCQTKKSGISSKMAAVALDRISACIVAGRRTVVQSAVSLRVGLSSYPFHHFPLDFSKSILTDI